jgi:hypothetical protein
MGLAFTAAGITFGYYALRVYQTASNRNFQSHQAWTIRSYSQVLSPMLYRYWYVLLHGLRLHDLGYMNCDASTEICPMYFQSFDMIHCWTYWLVPLAVAELIIYLLPKAKNPITEPDHESGVEIQSIDVDQKSQTVNGDNGSNNKTFIHGDQLSSTPTNEINHSYLGINVLSVCLSAVATVVTIFSFSVLFAL